MISSRKYYQDHDSQNKKQNIKSNCRKLTDIYVHHNSRDFPKTYIIQLMLLKQHQLSSMNQLN